MSALPPKADIFRGSAHVRFVPKADVKQLPGFCLIDPKKPTALKKAELAYGIGSYWFVRAEALLVAAPYQSGARGCPARTFQRLSDAFWELVGMGWKTPKLLNRSAMCGAPAILMTPQGVHSPSPQSMPPR